MLKIPKTYLVDEQNNRIAVQLDLPTFEKIEEILENYALIQLMQESEEENLDVTQATAYYQNLAKSS